MYARLPSGDATISCGSCPAGTRATICKFAGSTIASMLSLFSRTSNAGEGVCASARFAATKKTPSTDAPQIETRLFLLMYRMVLFPFLQRDSRRKFYTTSLSAVSPALHVLGRAGIAVGASLAAQT